MDPYHDMPTPVKLAIRTLLATLVEELGNRPKGAWHAVHIEPAPDSGGGFYLALGRTQDLSKVLDRLDGALNEEGAPT